MSRNHEETEFWINEAYTPLDRERVAALTQCEWEKFTKKTGHSKVEMKLASDVIPLGVTSSFQYWDPYPGTLLLTAVMPHLSDALVLFICSVDHIW